MIDVHVPSLLGGLGAGVVASALFFAGLAWGMQRALRARRPALWLMLSFVLRTLLLLGVGVWLGRWLAQPAWAWAGYALAFVLVRTLALRRAAAPQEAPCS